MTPQTARQRKRERFSDIKSVKTCPAGEGYGVYPCWREDKNSGRREIMMKEQQERFFRELKVTSNFGITVYGGVSERANTRRFYEQGREMFLALVEVNYTEWISTYDWGSITDRENRTRIMEDVELAIESASGLLWSEVKKVYEECIENK